MTNAETPAENTGGDTAAPIGPLGELPARVRVHALARLLGSSSREVLAKLTELGEPVRSVQSSVPKAVAIKVAEAFAGPADEVPGEGTQAAAESDTAEVTAAPVAEQGAPERPAPEQPEGEQPRQPEPMRRPHMPVFAAPSPVFLPPEPATAQPAPKPAREEAPAEEQPRKAEAPAQDKQDSEERDQDERDSYGRDKDDDEDGGGRRRRRRGRRGRGRGKGGEDAASEDENSEQQSEDGKSDEERKPDTESDSDDEDSDDGEGGSRRRRRRRRRKSTEDDSADGSDGDDPPNTVVHVRDGKNDSDKGDRGSDRGSDKGRDKQDKGDGVRSVRGSTRLEAKRQRRRDGREAGRRRAPILSEAEFLARREAVARTMVVAERNDHTQIGVLEDGVLVEHFVTSAGSGSIVGNVYLGRVQNVLPSMEAAFVDIGRGRNAVLYAGEVDWDAAGLEGKSRKIEQALSTGDNVLVQVTKDPVGHKGARLTTQISLPGRFLVYVPAGGATGISRKLPENERRRLKDILKRIVPEDAGVIIRTASEGISEEELERDVRRLKAQWEVIKEKADSASGGKKSSAPTMLYEEPDLLVKVVRDLFTEDFAKLEVQGATAWETISAYVSHVAPDLAERLKRYVGNGDVFSDYRIDEQITKALDRKVWLPSGGYLVIDRTEAMTVIDVNTGKFTGSGGNLEETVTRNNLESAEEIVRQLRLRDIGGIIVIDFIDMVLESNRELVLRRLTECLGRDRTRHQVAEVTSLGLVQMTRKKVGTGLLEAFSTPCEHCKGRGVVISTEPQRSGGGNGNGNGGHQHGGGAGNGGGGGSRRSRNRGKQQAEEPQQQERAAEPGPTPVQRESVVSAVQAMANASKLSPPKGEDAAEAAESTDVTAAEAKTEPKTEPKTEALEKSATETPDARSPGIGTWGSDNRTVESREQPTASLNGRGPADSSATTDQPAAEATTSQDTTSEAPAAAEAPETAEATEVAEATEATASTDTDTDTAAADAATDGAATDAASGEAATDAAASGATASRDAPSETEPEPEPEVDVPTPAVRTARRRPRRAATRPAGPPVHASDQS